MLGIFQCCYFVGVHVQSFLWSNLVHVWYDMKTFCLYTNLAAPFTGWSRNLQSEKSNQVFHLEICWCTPTLLIVGMYSSPAILHSVILHWVFLRPCPRGVLPPIYSIGFEAIWLWAFLHAKLGSLPSAFFHFCAALLFFLWAAIFLGLGFCFLWALNPCLSSHTSPISWLPPFWGWADVFTVHLGLSIYSFTVYTCLHLILHGKGYCNFFSIKL